MKQFVKGTSQCPETCRPSTCPRATGPWPGGSKSSFMGLPPSYQRISLSKTKNNWRIWAELFKNLLERCTAWVLWRRIAIVFLVYLWSWTCSCNESWQVRVVWWLYRHIFSYFVFLGVFSMEEYGRVFKCQAHGNIHVICAVQLEFFCCGRYYNNRCCLSNFLQYWSGEHGDGTYHWSWPRSTLMVKPRDGNFSTAGPVGPVYPGMDQKSVVPTWHQILSAISDKSYDFFKSAKWEIFAKKHGLL